MAKRNVLERLWRLRELEEEQSRLELEARVAERSRVAQNLAEISANAAKSRGDFLARLGDPDTAARTGALVELEHARRGQTAIRPRLDQAEAEVELQREEFLARRTGRRQVETLLDRVREAARSETARRAQQMLDDWYGRRGSVRKSPRQVEGARTVQLLPDDVVGSSMNSV
jgi:flagellar export protein FliJ